MNVVIIASEAPGCQVAIWLVSGGRSPDPHTSAGVSHQALLLGAAAVVASISLVS